MSRPSPFSLLLAFALAACGGDPARPDDTRPTSALNFLEPTAGAVLRTEASFWAVRGQERELRLYFAPRSSGLDSAEFLRLKVGDRSLLARPNGTPFAIGDSVLISVRVIEASRLILEFEPSGLRFDPAEPAELRLSLEEVDHDVDDDGDIDARDMSLLRQDVSLWRQEAAGRPWVRIGTAYFESFDEFESDISGFTNYALAF